MWVVKQGVIVSHDKREYRGGDVIPCTDAQAAAMPHAVERVEPAVAPVAVEKKRGK